MYAQTILELLNQLRADGVATRDVRRVWDAYDLAADVFTGLTRPSGKTFIAHAVGTASVLHAVAAPLDVTIAGVMHSIYAHGDFGRRKKGISESTRAEVRRAVGKDVEKLVAHYAGFAWNRTVIPVIAESVAAQDEPSRAVILMRLANEVEENLDGGVLYLPQAERRREADRPIVPALVSMAGDLGYPHLADELNRVFEETMAGTIPPGFADGRGPGVVSVVSESCRPKVHLSAMRLAARVVGRVRRTLLPARTG